MITYYSHLPQVQIYDSQCNFGLCVSYFFWQTLCKDINVVNIVFAPKFCCFIAILKLTEFTHFQVKLGNEQSCSGQIYIEAGLNK